MIDPRVAEIQKLLGGGVQNVTPQANTGMPPDALMHAIMQAISGSAGGMGAALGKANPLEGLGMPQDFPPAGTPLQDANPIAPTYRGMPPSERVNQGFDALHDSPMPTVIPASTPKPQSMLMMPGVGEGLDTFGGKAIYDQQQNEVNTNPMREFRPTGVGQDINNIDPNAPGSHQDVNADDVTDGGGSYDPTDAGAQDDEAMLNSVQDEVFGTGKGKTRSLDGNKGPSGNSEKYVHGVPYYKWEGTHTPTDNDLEHVRNYATDSVLNSFYMRFPKYTEQDMISQGFDPSASPDEYATDQKAWRKANRKRSTRIDQQ